MSLGYNSCHYKLARHSPKHSPMPSSLSAPLLLFPTPFRITQLEVFSCLVLSSLLRIPNPCLPWGSLAPASLYSGPNPALSFLASRSIRETWSAIPPAPYSEALFLWSLLQPPPQTLRCQICTRFPPLPFAALQ